MRYLILFLFFFNLTFGQLTTDLVQYKTLDSNSSYFFHLENVILVDDDNYYSYNSGFDLDNNLLPEFVEAKNIVFNVFDERKKIESFTSNEFSHSLTQRNSSDFLSSRIGEISFLENNRAILNNISLVYGVEKKRNKINFGNEIFTLNLSGASSSIEIPIYRYSGKFKMILTSSQLSALGVEITEENYIPLVTKFNNRVIEESLSVSSIRYELRRNPSYFSSYSIIPKAHSIIRNDVFNDDYAVKFIPKKNIIFVFDFIKSGG